MESKLLSVRASSFPTSSYFNPQFSTDYLCSSYNLIGMQTEAFSIFDHVKFQMFRPKIVTNNLQIKKEISIMKLARHPYVVRLHEAWINFLKYLFSINIF